MESENCHHFVDNNNKSSNIDGEVDDVDDNNIDNDNYSLTNPRPINGDQMITNYSLSGDNALPFLGKVLRNTWLGSVDVTPFKVMYTVYILSAWVLR